MHSSIVTDNNDLRIKGNNSNLGIRFDGNDGGSAITALRLDMANAGLAIFNAGVAIGGTGAANTLDDYEEGDYDAAITCASGTITLNSSFNRLSYTKVGRLVQVNGELKISAVSSPSGSTTLNLPFVVGNFTDVAGAATCPGLGYFNGSGITNGSYVTYQETVENTGYIRLYVKPTVSGASNIGDDNTAADSVLYINLTYQTDT